jgi:hypothetical protein
MSEREMTRDERIATIVKTLRPTDSGSWDVNIPYVTAEFDSYAAAQRQEIERLTTERDAFWSAINDEMGENRNQTIRSMCISIRPQAPWMKSTCSERRAKQAQP